MLMVLNLHSFHGYEYGSGIMQGWEMGLLVGLVRSALGSGYITKEEAWRYIEQANTLCADVLHTPEEIDKSFLIGKAMKSEKIEDWDRFLSCYSRLDKYRK